MMNKTQEQTQETITEKILRPRSGFLVLFLTITGILFSIFLIYLSFHLGETVEIQTAFGSHYEHIHHPLSVPLGMSTTFLLLPLLCLQFFGFKDLTPNEALVLTLFGKYYGTVNQPGFFHVNPFCVSYNPTKKAVVLTSSTGEENISMDLSSGKKISIKALTLNNRTQKVNDLDGNPVEVAAMVVWRVASPAVAVFAVDHYMEYISIQTDATLRSVVCRYPYDQGEISNSSQTLRANSNEISLTLMKELQEKVQLAGLEILEVKLTHLAYAPEIASAMLQRQQASAVLSARKLIVEGAVTIVQDALKKLDHENMAKLDDEKKATLISNLLVVLCANKEAQPIINTSSFP